MLGPRPAPLPRPRVLTVVRDGTANLANHCLSLSLANMMQAAARGCAKVASTAYRRQAPRVLRAYSSSVRCGDAAAAATPETDGGEAKPFASARVEDVFNKMSNLEREELSTIADIVNEKLGLEVSEWDLMGYGGAGVAASGGDAGGDAAGAEAVEEKTAFDLKLVSFDAKAKIKVIKEVRSIAGLGLKEAKELVEGAPKTVMKEIKKEEAEELKAKLEELGAVAEIV